MAVSMKKYDFAVSLKQRLEALGCLYTEGMDETAIADLLLNPGEGRLNMLHWLFSRYDSKLADFLDPSHGSFGNRTDSRLQRLLTAANSMCLCRYDDVELIRGEGSLSRQINFIDKLLDLVCIRDKENASVATFSQSSFAMSNQYLDALVSQDGFLNMLDPAVDLLPRDIRTEVEKMWFRDGWDGKGPPPVPSLQELATQSENLTEELEKHNATLESLQRQITLQGESKSLELITMTHMLSTVIRELRQLADGFTCCYETSISQWCHRTPPELSELGAVFKRVHGSLQTFSKLIEDLTKIRQVQNQLLKTAKEEPDVRQQVLVQASREASESFQQCLTILKETLHRSDSSFTSKHPPTLSV